VAVKTGSAVVTSEVIAYGVWPSIYPEPQKLSGLLCIFISYSSYSGNCEVELATMFSYTFAWLLITWLLYIFVVIDNEPCHVIIEKCPVYGTYTAIGSCILGLSIVKKLHYSGISAKWCKHRPNAV